MFTLMFSTMHYYLMKESTHSVKINPTWLTSIKGANISLSLAISRYFKLSLYHNHYHTHTHILSIFTHIYLSLYIFLLLYFSLYLCVSLSPYLTHSNFLSIYISLCLFFSQTIYHYISLCSGLS